MSVIGFFREQDPELAKIPDEDLVNWIVKDYPEFLQDKSFRNQARSLFGQQANEQASQEQLRSELDQGDQPPDSSQPITGEYAGARPLIQANLPNPLLSTAMGRAVTRGSAQMAQSALSASDAADAVQSAIGIPPNPINRAVKDYARSLFSGGEAIPPEGPASLSDALDQGPAGVGAYAIERGIGEQLPQLAAAAVTGGAGTIAGLSPKAAALVGIIATTFPQETGGAFQEIMQRAPNANPALAGITSAGIGAVNSFLETIGEGPLIERLMGGDQLAGRTVAEIVKKLAQRTAVQGAKEAGTEAAQEVLPALAPELFGAPRQEGLPERIGSAAFLGGVGGLGFGGGIDALQLGHEFGSRVVPTAQDRFMSRARDSGVPLVPLPNNEPQFTPGGVAQPGPININQGENLAAPGEAPPFPQSSLPITQNITSSVIPSDLPQQFAIPPVQPVAPANQAVASKILQRTADARQQAIAKAQALDQKGRQDLANVSLANGLEVQIDGIVLSKKVASAPVELPPVQAPVINQPNVAQVTPEEASSSNPVTGFTTALGSTYTVNDQGQTTRTKTLHQGHDITDVGLKPRSDETYYMSPDDARAIGMHGTLSGRKSLVVKNGRIYPVGWNVQQNRWGITESDKSGYAITTQPLVGLSPIELWGKHPDGTYASWHPGNPITEINKGDQNATSPVRSREEIAPQPGSTVETSQSQSGQILERPPSVGPEPLGQGAGGQGGDASRPTQTPEEVLTRRQSGETFNLQLTPSRQEAIQKMSTLPVEELDQARSVDANGIPNGKPNTNEGKLAQAFFGANAVIRQMAEAQGLQLDAESEANLERRYQEQAFNQYDKAQSKGVPFNRVFNKGQAFRAALKDTARMSNTIGNLRGKITSTEVQTEEGSRVNPEVEQAAQQSPQDEAYDSRTRVLDFLDQFEDQNHRAAAVNLLADELHYPRPIQNPNAKQSAFENDSQTKQTVAEFAKAFSADRNSIASAVQSPLTEAEVTTFAQKLLPDLSKVQVVNDPGLVDKNGQPIRAQYLPEQDKPFLLNAAFLGSEQDVRDALNEEMMHSAFADPEVKDAFDKVVAELTPEDLQSVANYPADVRQEEAAVRKVINQINAKSQQGAIKTFVQKVVDAIKRLFGIQGTDHYDQILSRALQARAAQTVENRNSISQGIWRNITEARAEADVSGDPEAILKSAAAQGSIVPEKYLTELQVPASNRSETVTQRLLRSITDQVEMGHELLSAGAPVSPDALPLASGLTAGAANAKDIAAEAIIKQSMMIQNKKAAINTQIGKWLDQYDTALGKFPAAVLAKNDADLYRGLADQLAGDYQRYLTEKSLTLKSGAFNPEIQKLISEGSRRITEEYRGVGNAVASALQNIAKEIPESALATPQATRDWITQRLQSSPALMSDRARDWLTSPVAGGPSPLERDPRINQRLAAVKELANGNSVAIQSIKDFQKAFGNRNVTPEAFMRKWNSLQGKYSSAISILKEINGTISRLDDNLTGGQAAVEMLDRITNDPQYQANVDEAVKHLNAGSTVRVYERMGDNGPYTGNVLYHDPLTDKIVSVDLQPNVGTEKENLNKLEGLLANVQEWMAHTDDRVARASWEKESDWLKRYAFNIAGGVVTGHMLGGYRMPSMFQIMPFSRDLFGFFDVQGPAYQRIGNRLIQPAVQAAKVYGNVDKELRILSDQSEAMVKSSVVEAAKSHGLKGTREDILNWWKPNILEPIISQWQNPTAKPYKVGDYISGEKITKEDFKAATTLKARDKGLFNLLQGAEKDSHMHLLWYHPLQTAEEFVKKPLSRRSVDYGLKMPRRPLSRQNERGRTFTDKWVKAKPGERRQLLADNFSWVLMGNGLLTNTDQEFNPGVNKEDRALFDKARNLDRANETPFHDLDSLIEWAGKEQVTEDKSEAEASADFAIRLLGTVDSFVHAFDKALKIVPKETLDAFKQLAVPAGVIDSIGVGDSPFLTPRGKMVAPPSFYQYSQVSDNDWGALQAGARSALMLRALEANSVAKAAIDKEVERYEDKNNGLIVQEQNRIASLPAPQRSGPFSAVRRLNRSTLQAADHGDLMYDLLTLKQHQRTLQRFIDDLRRVASEHVTYKEDNQTVKFLRDARQSLTSSLLQSIVSVTNNVFGGTVANALYQRGLGNYGFASSYGTIPLSNVRYVVDNVLSKMRKVPGVDPVVRAALATPGVRKIAEILVAEQMRYESDRLLATNSRTVDEPSSADKATLSRLFPETGGRLAEEDPNPLIWLVNSTLNRVPGLTRTLEASKNTFPGAADRMINQVTTRTALPLASQIADAAHKAWEIRDTGHPGWDDLASPLNRFVPKDLGLRGQTDLNFWRNMLSSAGSIESLSLDHYKREKASGTSQPFLTDGQIAQVAQEIGKATNMGSAENTPLISQGRGLSGEARKWLMMLSRYTINFAAVNENVAGRAYGDMSTARKRWAVMSTAIAAVLTAIVTSFGSEIGQWLRQVLTGDPKTRTSIGTVMEDPNLSDLAKYTAISLTSVVPFLGERIAQAFGGSSGKPLLDATRMFAPLGLAADLEQTAMRIYQTGDMTFPLADLARRYVPLSGAVINRVLPGEQDSREALRALRLAAPSDMQTQQVGGPAGRQTPLTPLLREAVNKAYAGDTSGSKAALDKAVQFRVEHGQTQKDAEQAVKQSFAARDPERLTFGRTLEPDERRRLISRMGSSQADAYNRSRQIFAKAGRPHKVTANARRQRIRSRLVL